MKFYAFSPAQQLAAFWAGNRAPQISRQLVSLSGYLDTAKIPVPTTTGAELEGRKLSLDRFHGQAANLEQPNKAGAGIQSLTDLSEGQADLPDAELQFLIATELGRSQYDNTAGYKSEDPEVVHVNLEAIIIWLLNGAPFQSPAE